MKGRHLLAVTVLLLSGTTDSVLAQNRAIVLLAHGAFRLPTSSLNDQGDDVSAHWAGGGGLGLQLAPNLALRGSASMGGGTLRSSDPRLEGISLRRAAVLFDLQVGVPTASGWNPYIIAGAGFVHTSPRATGAEVFTSFSPHFGAGTMYVMDNRFLSLFWEVGGILYGFDALGLSSYQFDLELRAGITYAIPF